MKLKSLSTAISVLATGSLFMPLSYAQTATPITQNFKSIHAPINAKSESASNHFVRIDRDSVVAWQKKQEQLGVKVTKTSKNAYIASVKAELKKVAAKVETAGFTVINPVFVTDVGFTITATKEQAAKLTQQSDIKAIVPKRALKKQRTYSTRWIGGERAHQEYGVKGNGQTIAIIDTGIDYFHSDFLGSGNSDDFAGNDPTLIEPGSFPTQTVVGGFDFAGFDYDAGFPESSIPQPDPDPVDDGNHGSHVAGIAAGRAIGSDSATGIAPEASLFAMKVFGAAGSTDLVSQAIERSIDPNGDGDPDDAVDVINMSLGSIFGSPDATTAVSAENAVAAGAVVVVSAGNSGNDIPYISGSPAAAESVIAVASSIAGGVESFFLSFTADAGDTFEFFAPYAGISPPLAGVIQGPLSVAEPYDACNSLTNNFDGNVALITRGGCAFTTKLTNALNAGASAAVVVNNVPGPAFAMGGDDAALPGAMITQAEGDIILSQLDTLPVAVAFAADNTRADSSDDDTMSGFSSRGPGPTGLFKPDVTAPGDSIESARAGSGTASLTISGTSMAAPQVAGMAALLREKFPTLEPLAIKAIIQNTARPARVLGESGTPPLSLQGTGIVDIEKALNSTAYVAPGGIGFGVFKPEYNDAAMRWVEVTNFSSEDQRFSISVEGNLGASSAGVVVDVSQEIYVAAGQTQKVPVTLRMQSNAVESTTDFQEFDGWIVFKSATSDIRVGYTAVIEPASRIDMNVQGDSYQFRNVAFGDANIFGYTMAQSEAANLGYRSISPEIAVFAFNAQEDWTNFSKYRFQMTIDVDEDGTADYQASVADLNLLAPDDFDDITGDVGSALENLETGSGNLLYLAQAGYNNSVLQFQLDMYGDNGFLKDGDTTFSYTLTMENIFSESGELELVGTGRIDLSQQVEFETPAMLLPAQQGVTIDVDGDATPIYFIPSESTPSKRVKVGR